MFAEHICDHLLCARQILLMQRQHSSCRPGTESSEMSENIPVQTAEG